MEIAKSAAAQLNKLVSDQPPTASTLKRISKKAVFPILASRVVTGKEVGQARLALRLTIKNVWDYPEMQRRKLTPTACQIGEVQRELKVIRSTAGKIQSVCD